MSGKCSVAAAVDRRYGTQRLFCGCGYAKTAESGVRRAADAVDPRRFVPEVCREVEGGRQEAQIQNLD